MATTKTTTTIDHNTKTTSMTTVVGNRKLTAKWTIDLAQDMQALHGINLEDELSKILQEEIDNEVLIELLTKSGWFTVNLSKTNEDIKSWCKDNLGGGYHYLRHCYMFELERDASMFLLKWV